jgi:hypothetical protein
MRKHSAFRPLVMDSLEDRVVLSTASVTAHAAARQHTPLSPQTVATDKLMNAYSTFIKNFSLTYSNNIEYPESNGSQSDLSSFSKQLGQELNVLAKSAVKSLGPEPAGAAVVTEVRQATNGTASNSLRTRLANATIAGLNNGSVLTSYQNTATTVIQQNYTLVKQDVLAALPSTTTSPSSPSTSS